MQYKFFEVLISIADIEYKLLVILFAKRHECSENDLLLKKLINNSLLMF